MTEVSQSGTTIGSSFMMPGVIAGGCALSTVGKYGIKNLGKIQNQAAFRELDTLLKNQGVDVFTRSSALAKAYKVQKDSANALFKAANKQSKGVGLFQRAKNVLRSDARKVTTESLEAATDAARTTFRTNYDAIQKASKTGIVGSLDDALGLDNVFKSIQGGAKAKLSPVKGLFADFATNFKKEASFKQGGLFVYGLTALSLIPRITNEVIPTFKEKGFGAGLKSLGKAVLGGAADLFSGFAGGAIGRTLGAAIGNVILPGVGGAAGAFIGDMACSAFFCGKATELAEKIGGEDEEKTAQQQVVNYVA